MKRYGWDMAEGNPLDVLPPRLRQWGSTSAALAFLKGRDRQLGRMDGVWNVHVKISVGGPWAAGKSTIVRAIAEDRVPDLGRDNRTIGIDLFRWNPAASGPYSDRLLDYFGTLDERRRSVLRFPTTFLQRVFQRGRFELVEDAGRRCCFEFFDLGGQDEYRTAHLHFVNDSDVAMVVFDAKRTMKGSDGAAAEQVDIDAGGDQEWKPRSSPEDVVEWISAIYAASGSAKLMLVGTHALSETPEAKKAGEEVWDALRAWAREHQPKLQFLCGLHERKDWYDASFDDVGRHAFHFVDVAKHDPEDSASTSELKGKPSVCESIVNAAVSPDSCRHLAGFGEIQSQYAEFLANQFAQGAMTADEESKDWKIVSDWPEESHLVTVDMCAKALQANSVFELGHDLKAARREAREALKQLHDSGRALYWKKEGGLVFTRVQWVLNFAREVLRHNVRETVIRNGANETVQQLAGILEQEGICHKRLLHYLWPALRGDAVIKMMEVVCEIELAVKCEDDDGFGQHVLDVGGDGTVWLIPTRRPQNTAGWALPDCDSVTVGEVAVLKESLHPGVFARTAMRIAAHFSLTDLDWWECSLAGLVEWTEDAKYEVRIEADTSGQEVALRVRVQLLSSHAPWAPKLLARLQNQLRDFHGALRDALEALGAEVKSDYGLCPVCASLLEHWKDCHGQRRNDPDIHMVSDDLFRQTNALAEHRPRTWTMLEQMKCGWPGPEHDSHSHRCDPMWVGSVRAREHSPGTLPPEDVKDKARERSKGSGATVPSDTLIERVHEANSSDDRLTKILAWMQEECGVVKHFYEMFRVKPCCDGRCHGLPCKHEHVGYVVGVPGSVVADNAHLVGLVLGTLRAAGTAGGFTIPLPEGGVAAAAGDAKAIGDALREAVEHLEDAWKRELHKRIVGVLLERKDLQVQWRIWQAGLERCELLAKPESGVSKRHADQAMLCEGCMERARELGILLAPDLVVKTPRPRPPSGAAVAGAAAEYDPGSPWKTARRSTPHGKYRICLWRDTDVENRIVLKWARMEKDEDWDAVSSRAEEGWHTWQLHWNTADEGANGGIMHLKDAVVVNNYYFARFRRFFTVTLKSILPSDDDDDDDSNDGDDEHFVLITGCRGPEAHESATLVRRRWKFELKVSRRVRNWIHQVAADANM